MEGQRSSTRRGTERSMAAERRGKTHVRSVVDMVTGFGAFGTDSGALLSDESGREGGRSRGANCGGRAVEEAGPLPKRSWWADEVGSPKKCMSAQSTNPRAKYPYISQLNGKLKRPWPCFRRPVVSAVCFSCGADVSMLSAAQPQNPLHATSVSLNSAPGG